MGLLEKPDDSQTKIVCSQLGEDSDKLEHNLKLLQEWIACQPHLPQDYDNSILPTFIRGCKHNLERCKKKIEMYFIVRAKVPELFCNREPTEDLLEHYNKMMTVTPLPKLTPDGYRVTIFKITCPDGSLFDIKHVLRHVYMVADVRVTEENLFAGDIFVYDVGNLKAAHLANYVAGTKIVGKAIAAAHEAYPQRLQQLHFLNAPLIIEKFLNITKAFLKEKMRNRFIIHDSVESLLKSIPGDILPEEYGGTSGKYGKLVHDWTSYLISRKKWFQQQDGVKAAGTIPDRVFYRQFDDVTGVEGSFRKLNID